VPDGFTDVLRPIMNDDRLEPLSARLGTGLPFDPDEIGDGVRDGHRSGGGQARAKIADCAGHLGQNVTGWSAVKALASRDFFDGTWEPPPVIRV
jgi:hypothetical protein